MFESLTDLVKRIPKSYYIPLSVAIIGLIFFVYGLIQYFGNSSVQQTSTVDVATPSVTPVKTVKIISVDVEGAVLHAGVVTLPVNSRVEDALIESGGLSDKADRDFIAKHMNLAAKLVDGGKIYIPRIGESILDGAQTATNGEPVVIDINAASADVLDGLPGIGPTTAEKIITNRPYTDVKDLLTKKIIGQKVFDQIKDKLMLN
jgi:DNA uptake protein ComE-like DNA-binding protein